MFRKIFLSLLLILHSWLLKAQVVTTVLPSGSGIDESLFITQKGKLFGTGYANGSLTTFIIGNSAIVLDSLNGPSEMTQLSNGMIVVTENLGNRILLFDPLNSTEQLLTTSIPNPAGIIKMRHSDTLLVSSTSTNNIYRLAPDGDTSLYLSSAYLNSPVSLIFDDSNSLYIANYNNGMILKQSSNGSISPFCTLPTSTLGHMIKVGNMIYATGVFSHQIYRVSLATASWVIYTGMAKGSLDGNIRTAQFNSPNGITANATGDSIYISEYNTQTIRLISGVTNNVGLNKNGHKPISNSLKIWPNPAERSLFLSGNHVSGPLVLQLYDLKGLLLWDDIPTQNISEDVLSLTLQSNLKDGIYFLVCLSTATTDIKKIIIRNE